MLILNVYDTNALNSDLVLQIQFDMHLRLKIPLT